MFVAELCNRVTKVHHGRLKLWDSIFAEDLHPTLQIVDYVCLAMLLRIRESLLDADCKLS